MQVIKYLCQGYAEYEILVHTYSKEEWVEMKKKEFGKETGCLGVYFTNDWSIHIIRKEDFPKGTRIAGVNATWENILMHEYIHYRQHMKGYWGDFELIDPKGKGIPMTKGFKHCYHEEAWGYEAEAYWYMYRPQELGLKIVLA